MLHYLYTALFALANILWAAFVIFQFKLIAPSPEERSFKEKAIALTCVIAGILASKYFLEPLSESSYYIYIQLTEIAVVLSFVMVLLFFVTDRYSKSGLRYCQGILTLTVLILGPVLLLQDMFALSHIRRVLNITLLTSFALFLLVGITAKIKTTKSGRENS